MNDATSPNNILEFATELTIAWLANPNTRAPAEEVPLFLQKMHTAVADLASPAAASGGDEAEPEYAPAVSVRRSLSSKDHIVSMIDGKPYKMLKRHLATHGLTPDQYRERYGLKADYPMVAENYASMRRHYAKKIGLGRKTGEKVVSKQATSPATEPKAASSTRRKSPTVSRAARGRKMPA